MRKARLLPSFKKSLSVLASCALIFTTTGCIKFDLDLQVNSDSTVSGTMILAVSEVLSELGDEQTPKLPTDDLIDPTAEGVTTEPYDDGEFVGQKVTLDRFPFSEFSNGWDLTIQRDGDLITLKGFLDFGEETDQDSSQEDLSGVLGEAFVKSLFASADLRIRVTFPAEVVSTTGSLSENRRTVTWTPDIGEKLDLTTTVRVPSFNLVLYVAAGLGALLIVAVTLLLIKRRKPSNVVSGDSIGDSDQKENIRAEGQ
jgi:hypothetical protein